MDDLFGEPHHESPGDTPEGQLAGDMSDASDAAKEDRAAFLPLDDEVWPLLRAVYLGLGANIAALLHCNVRMADGGRGRLGCSCGGACAHRCAGPRSNPCGNQPRWGARRARAESKLGFKCTGRVALALRRAVPGKGCGGSQAA